MRLLIPFVVAVVTPLFFSSSPAFSQAESVSRAGAISEQSPVHPNLPAAINATFSEGFEGTFPPTGWIVRNQSTAIGTNPTCWNQFTAATPWVAHSGANHAGANYNCTSGTNTISGWLITSAISGFANGDQVSFWTRTSTASAFPDRLELRLCLDSTPGSCGLATSTGTGSAAVGDFTSVLLTVNPTLVASGYPETYTQFSATLAGLPAGPNNGRLGFRYFVTGGGPNGTNSNILSIDDVSVSGPAAAADLSITKTDGVTSATPGGAVIYTITASNAGPSGASGSTVADTFPASETCTWTCLGAGGGTCTAAGSGNINDSVNLPSGGSTTYTASCAISAAATGSLANTATVAAPAGVTDPTPGNNSATDTDTLNASADLAITKTDGVTTATPGGSVTYTITASNAGPSNAIAATVADTFPASETCTWTCLGAGGGTCAVAGSGNINDSVNLPSGGSTTYTASCTISAAATGSLDNTATVTAPAGVTDPTPGNNSATDSDGLAISADVAITISDSRDFVQVGDSLDYLIEVTNAAGPSAVSANVSDILPAVLTNGSWICAGTGGATCSANGTGNTLSDTATLPVGGTASYLYSTTLQAADPSDLVQNTATVSLVSGIDPNNANDQATDTDTIVIFRDGFDPGAGSAPQVVGSGEDNVTAQLRVDAALLAGLGIVPVEIASGKSSDGKTLFTLQMARFGSEYNLRILTRDNLNQAERTSWQLVDMGGGLLDFAWQSAAAQDSDSVISIQGMSMRVPMSSHSEQGRLTHLMVRAEHSTPWLVLIAN